MNKKQKIVLLVTGLFLILLCGGLSYAFFSTVTNNESSSTILAKGGKMTIKYANGSGTIKIQNIYPREEAWVNKSFTVTGNNTTDLEMNYRLYLVVSNNAFNFGNLTYSISGTTTNSTDTLINKSNQPIPKMGQILMGAAIFKSKTSTHSYNLRIFYKETGENQNNGQGKSFAGYVKIDSGSTLAYDALIKIVDNNFGSIDSAFNGPITKEQVEKVTFNNTNTVPSNAINSWDVSDKQNGSVMAYTLDEDNDGLYEVYIGQNGGVVANPNSQYLFARFSKLGTINLTNLDTSNVTTMYGMFHGSSATELNGLNQFNTSKVINMYQMFYGSAATSLDLSSFDTSKVTYMSYMFDGCAATEIKGLTNLNTSNVTDMSYMFYKSKATSLDLSGFDTSNVTDMSDMFSSSAATEIKGLNQFNTSNVTDMSSMFSNSAATNLDVSSFDTSNVTTMYYMFFGSDAIEVKGLTQFNTSNVTNMRSMFGSSAATTLDLSSFDTSNVTNMSYMFSSSAATEIKGLNQFNTSKVTTMERMFGSSAATTLNLSSFNTSKVTNMSEMFSKSKATSLDLSSFDTSNVTSMYGMFYESKATEIKGLDKFDTSKVTRMDHMFWGSAATSLDLSSFDTSNVTNMSYMFCYSTATTLDLSSFDTTKVTDMSYMFSFSAATTGYARTQEDADKFNASSSKPSGLTFVVKS